LRVNTEYAKLWPNITTKKEGPADGKEFDGRPGKFAEFFSPKPGEGD
jgi:ferredoxin